ncbi:MAG: Mediator of RNA polymerase II transcription subunit 10 [Lasallia pustulata]|uniref:Mediator of RNA polymerase II transcription subunit 10 n=1 Tax=Lasallia pustulata TaxID=136370 RepID=A0A5M8PEY7_9LECA|nr:MAG: Mediator of RNA polymerase II transcription subunit 10 [Lasallia pustulata]
MAPVTLDTIDARLKDVIQTLFELQSAIHGYLGPETHQELIRKISHLSSSLSTLSTTAASLPTQIPPEIVEYVEDGRNPDIYTREFVELVQRGNAALRGKSEAFAGFRDVLAEEIRGGGGRGEGERGRCGRRWRGCWGGGG